MTAPSQPTEYSFCLVLEVAILQRFFLYELVLSSTDFYWQRKKNIVMVSKFDTSIDEKKIIYEDGQEIIQPLWISNGLDVIWPPIRGFLTAHV